MAQMVKNLPAMWDIQDIPGLERSPGGGNGNPPQYSWLENPMDRGAWWATVQGVAKSWTRLKCMRLGKAPFLPLTISFNFIIMFIMKYLKLWSKFKKLCGKSYHTCMCIYECSLYIIHTYISPTHTYIHVHTHTHTLLNLPTRHSTRNLGSQCLPSSPPSPTLHFLPLYQQHMSQSLIGG